jgi:gluconokinase
LEAIAFRFARVYSILCRHIPGVQAIIGSGVGLIRSPAWQQILADALGQPIALSCIPEATARGAALLALEALGAIPQLEALPPEIGTMIYPRSDATNVYRAAAARQDALYRQIGQTFEEQGTNAKT